MNERPILRADPAYRKKMIRIFLSALLVGFILLSLAIPKLENATLAKDPGKALITIKLILVLLLVIPALLCIYLLRIAINSIKLRQFPPPGTKVIKDTPIFSDAEAVKRGLILLFFALILMFLCLFSAALAYSFVGTWA